MKLSPEKKKEILLQSFEVLKEDYSNNSLKLKDIIAKMFAIDIDIAVDMWKFLLKKYSHYLRDEDESYFLSEGIVYEAGQKIGGSQICDVVLNEEFLKQVVFNVSACTSGSSWGIIHTCIYAGNSTIVNELLELVYRNKNVRRSFGSYIEGMLDELETDSSISDQVIAVLFHWAEKVNNKQEKAKINIALLDLTSDQEDDDDE